MRISILGPIAAVFGRAFEVFIVEEYTLTTCLVKQIHDSIDGSKGTLNMWSFEGIADYYKKYGPGWTTRESNWQDQSYSSSSWK